MRVFDVHHLIANIVGSLYQIYKRMAGETQRFAGCRPANNAQFIGYFAIRVCFRGKEAKLSLLSCRTTFEGVLHDAGQHAISHYKTASPSSVKAVGEQAEGIGVTLKMGEVGPEVGRQFVFQRQSRAF